MRSAENHVVNGVLVGTVSGEPDELGRVEVHYEWMEGESTSFRAPIATFLSGGGRGGWMMPEDGDEVLVAFDQGRFDAPFVVGFLWNGNQRPPNDDVDYQVRRLQTVSGHRLDFDDRENATRITMHSAGGHELVLDDAEATQGVTLTTSGGHRFEVADREKKAVLRTNGGHQVVLDDTAGTLTLQSKGGMSLEIDSLGRVSIFAPAGVEVKAARASFSGIVEAKMVRATLGQFESVVCPAHSPGWGTTLP